MILYDNALLEFKEKRKQQYIRPAAGQNIIASRSSPL
jgi:hypothetical protein